MLVPEQGNEAAPRQNTWTSTAQAVANHLRKLIVLPIFSFLNNKFKNLINEIIFEGHSIVNSAFPGSSQPNTDTDEEMVDLNSSAITIDSSSDNETVTSPNTSSDRNHSRVRDDDGNVEFEYD